ncbi:hypothetical protein [Aureibaculum luteum]|nr:hypothetical protein [Aureibaculum luteum]
MNEQLTIKSKVLTHTMKWIYIKDYLGLELKKICYYGLMFYQSSSYVF